MKLTAVEGDKVGAAYVGDARQSSVDQLADANKLRAKFMVAEQVLTLFGGFSETEGLRNQVNALQARNNQLIEQLEQLQRYLAGMESALLSARSDDSENTWYPVDEQRNLINNLGYGRHRAVLAMDEVRRQVQEKQRYLRELRGKITQAVLAGNTAEARRLAEMMRLPGDPMADPTDTYAEQSRFRVQEPYTQRLLTHLDDVVALLEAQLEQVEQLNAWLPLVPEVASGEARSSPLSFRVNRPLVRWTQVLPGVDEALRKGTFADARRLIEGVRNGEPGATVYRAASWVMRRRSTPPSTGRANRS